MKSFKQKKITIKKGANAFLSLLRIALQVRDIYKLIIIFLATYFMNSGIKLSSRK